MNFDFMSWQKDMSSDPTLDFEEGFENDDEEEDEEDKEYEEYVLEHLED